MTSYDKGKYHIVPRTLTVTQQTSSRICCRTPPPPTHTHARAHKHTHTHTGSKRIFRYVSSCSLSAAIRCLFLRRYTGALPYPGREVHLCMWVYVHEWFWQYPGREVHLCMWVYVHEWFWQYPGCEVHLCMWVYVHEWFWQYPGREVHLCMWVYMHEWFWQGLNNIRKGWMCVLGSCTVHNETVGQKCTNNWD